MKKKLKIFFKISINMSGIPLKLIRMQIKLTVISYLHYEKFMIKTKDLGSPWKTKGIKKSSKKKERLYSKRFKKEMKKWKKNIKITKSFSDLLRSGQRIFFLN